MFHGAYFILSTMQAGTTPIVNVFGMTGPSTNGQSNPQILLVIAGCKSGSINKSEIIPKRILKIWIYDKKHVKHSLMMNFFRGVKVKNSEISLKSENLHYT